MKQIGTGVAVGVADRRSTWNISQDRRLAKKHGVVQSRMTRWVIEFNSPKLEGSTWNVPVFECFSEVFEHSS